MAGMKKNMITTMLAAASMAVLLSLLGSAPAQAGQRPACANANARVADATVRELSVAVKCLIDRERRKADRARLSPNADLSRVAKRHAGVMVDRDCFGHRCRGEAALEDRIIRSGYLNRGGRYGFAESLGCATTPSAMVSLWMSKRYDKRNILGRRYRDIGIGVERGRPEAGRCQVGGPKATYTVIFAWRSRPPGRLSRIG